MSNQLEKTLNEIMDKYEVPGEYLDAVCDAYEEGAKRGFIDASIKAFNEYTPTTPSNTQGE